MSYDDSAYDGMYHDFVSWLHDYHYYVEPTPVDYVEPTPVADVDHVTFERIVTEEKIFGSVVNSTAFPIESLNMTDDTDGGSVNHNLPMVYGNVAYALSAYKVLVPVMFAVMLLLIVLCFTVFCMQYKRLSPISTSVYAMLISITIFNFLTITGSFAEHTYLYNKKSDIDLLPFDSCDTLYKLEKWSQICHAVSIWLTASMTIQKCICICKPFAAIRVVSFNATVLLILTSILLGIAPFILKFFDSSFSPYVVTDVGKAGQTYTTCRRKLASFITDPLKYMLTTSWVLLIMSRFLPCILILITSIIMIVQLRKHSTMLRKMTEVKRNAKITTVSQKTRVVKLVFFVAMVVFVVEITISIVSILFLIQFFEDVDIIDTETTRNAAFGIDIVLYVSYVVILMSYCLTPRTIKQFRTRMSEIRSIRSSGPIQTKLDSIGDKSSSKC